ncbi:MAG: DUF3068 domain-containing protein [Marmoricola sp.]
MATTTLDAKSANRRSEEGRRNLAGAGLAGVGALLFVLALMVHFYVAPTLSIAPIDQDSVTHLEAKGATVFDTASLKPITTDLAIAAHTVGDVKASQKAGGDTRVWMNNTTITSSDGVIRSQSQKRAAFDGKSSVGVNCASCENYYSSEKDQKVATKLVGLLFKWPFGTEKKTYQVWDDTAAAAVPTHYTGTTTVEGLKVYTFENDVPGTVIGNRDVPESIFGLSGTENVTADSYYQNHSVYYIEPVTGAIVNQVTDTKNWFQYDGNQVVTTQAHITYTPQQVKDMVHKTLGNQPSLLSQARGWLPWVAGFIGLGLISLGYALTRGRRHSA